MPPTTHPTDAQLSDFALGRLDEAAAAELCTHLDECDACRTAVERAGDDTFAAVVRKAGATELITIQVPVMPAALLDHPRYQVVRQVGSGGMGTVYEARHTLMDRRVALKVISPHLVHTPDLVERFRREVRAAAKLSHPNIVTAHDAEQAGDAHFLVMEYVEGRSLDRVVAKRGPLPVEFACHCVRQAALGLQHASEQGMVHRDLKPHNLMLTPRGQVKVLDFGMARLTTDRAAPTALTSPDVVMGTPDFIAPEQAQNAASADIRSDIYALGCTLYFLLTGRPPFPHGTAMEKLMAHYKDEPTPVEELRPEVPAEVAGYVRRMMAKDPTDRPQTPAEVAKALAGFVKPGAAGVPPAFTPPPVPVAETERVSVRPTAVRRRKRPARRPAVPGWAVGLVIAVGVLLVLGGLSAAVLQAWQNRTNPSSQASRSSALSAATPPMTEPPRGTPTGGGPRVVIVLPHRGFWYPDYGPLRERLDRAGYRVTVASTDRSTAQPAQADGGFAKPVTPDALVDQIRPEEFDAVVCVGGTLPQNLVGNPATQQLLTAMKRTGKYITGICAGTATLADAGVLDGVEATGAEIAVKFVKQKRPDVRIRPEKNLVEDGRIITARGPEDVEAFVALFASRVKK